MKAEASFILNKAAINKIDGTEARHYSELAEEAARNAEADAERAEEVAREMESLDGRLDALEETVGDSSAGLVKDVSDAQGDITALETTIGDSSAGLVKDVSDAQTDISALETTVGDATGGLVKDVDDLSDLAVGIMNDITALQAKVVKEVTVSGTTPVIIAEANTRYICGTVATLSFTPPATGITDIIFTSGSTPTVLTVPNTVRWANEFDPTFLIASKTYELNIMDGIGIAINVEVSV